MKFILNNISSSQFYKKVVLLYKVLSLRILEDRH